MTFLIGMLDLGDDLEHEVAERLIDRLEDGIGQAISDLAIDLLCDERPGVRAAILRIIGHYDPTLDARTREAAYCHLTDSDPHVRHAAIRLVVQSAWQLDSDHPAIHNLIRCLEDPVAENRVVAFEALDEMGGGIGAGGWLLLAEQLRHHEKGVRVAARELLTAKGQEAFVRLVEGETPLLDP